MNKPLLSWLINTVYFLLVLSMKNNGGMLGGNLYLKLALPALVFSLHLEYREKIFPKEHPGKVIATHFSSSRSVLSSHWILYFLFPFNSHFLFRKKKQKKQKRLTGLAVSSVSKSDKKKAHSNKQWQRQNTAFCRPRLFRYQLVSCLWKSPPLYPCYQGFLFFFSLSCGGILRLTSGLKIKILVMYTESARKSL